MFDIAFDIYVQRYIPSKSNKNSVMRVVWNRGTLKVSLLILTLKDVLNKRKQSLRWELK